MNIVQEITRFVERIFKTTLEIFLEALRLSPNARGYLRGSITELLLKKKLEEEYGFEVKRIREKWEGTKHARHHGDFYFRKVGSPYWYVIESKGVKSNSEKWHKLYNFENLQKFLITHAEKIPWVNQEHEVEHQIIDWIRANLPKFMDEYSSTLYEFEEVQSYKTKRDTPKARAIAALRGHTRDQINQMVEERLNYVMSRMKVLETHFVSGRSGVSERTQATPRKDEFNVLAIDIVLRYPQHRFLFANPKNLESSGGSPHHLQQNYIMGFIFADEQGETTLNITDDWYEDLTEVCDTLEPEDSVGEKDMQIDNRSFVENEDEE